VSPEALIEVLSSKARLRIADAISLRPRTLNELSSATGISVQGVLRHLKRLADLGLVEESKLNPQTPKARRVYLARGTILGDYSAEGLTIVKSTEKVPPGPSGTHDSRDLERLSGDILLQRRRIRDETRRLGRMIDDLVDDQLALTTALEEMPLGDQERLILEVLFTEETMTDGVRVLSRYYGLDDRRSIDKALAQAKSNAIK